MTLAQHDTAHRHQRDRREPELIGPEHRGNDHVAAGLQRPVGLNTDASAQIVHDQDLLRLGQAQLHR